MRARRRKSRPPGLGLALLFAVKFALLAVGSAFAKARWGSDMSAVLIALGGIADIDWATAAVGALPPGTLTVEVAALALAAIALALLAPVAAAPIAQ